MKKIISTCIALMVSAACSISAFAMEVPTNTTIQDLNGVRQYIKIYTVAPDTDPQSLIDDVFEYDGYTYTYLDVCELEVLEPRYSDNFVLKLLYEILSKKTSQRVRLPDGVFDMTTAVHGIYEE